MKFKKIIKHKKHLVLGLLLSTLLLTGCVKTTNDPLEVPAKTPSVKQENNPETEKKVPSQSTEETQESQTEPIEESTVSVNTTREEVSYRCEDGIDLNRAEHRCASDGANLYLAYAETDLYVLVAGESKHQPVGLKNPAELKVCNVTIDTEGKIHLLMATPELDKWYIWQLDDAMQPEKEVNITPFFVRNRIPLWFMVDKDGYYYLQWIEDRKGLILDTDGALIHETTCAALGVNWIYEATVGKDGSIYLVYNRKGENKKIGTLDTKLGSLRQDGIILKLPETDTFSAMAAGTDTEILLYGPYCGVWSYDSEIRTFEQRIKPEDIGYSGDMDFRPLGFQADGRFVTVGGAMESNARVKELLLKYIPAGR